jgi:transcriptional regulator with XRE-family HTH domain
MVKYNCEKVKKNKEGETLMVTAFGKFCRKLRIDEGELLLDMANKLNVSTAFLSKVENGRRKPPENWENEIISLYHLSGKKEEEFKECFFYAKNMDSIDIRTFDEDDRNLMLSFARKFNSLDKDALKKMLDE